jgi:hypothetical protein
MEVKRVRKLIDDNSNDLAFIIGNGLNRYYKTSKSWEDILQQLWRENSFETISQFPIGVSFTEIYDFLDMNNRYQIVRENKLQKRVVEILEGIELNKDEKKVIKRIEELNAPILTTNFDDFIKRDFHLEYYSFSGKKFTDFYPWESYFSRNEMNNPLSDFSLWHINGMVKYHRSIKLGLGHYMGNVNRARAWLHGNLEDIEFSEKNQKKWPGMKSWLHILFNKSIFILGLGLEENEVFLRWLLIERAKYFRQFPSRKKESWYVKEKNEDNKGKEFYLRMLGFEIIEMDNYKQMYEDIWE